MFYCQRAGMYAIMTQPLDRAIQTRLSGQAG